LAKTAKQTRLETVSSCHEAKYSKQLCVCVTWQCMSFWQLCLHGSWHCQYRKFRNKCVWCNIN